MSLPVVLPVLIVQGEVSLGAGSFDTQTVDAYGSITRGDLFLSAGLKYLNEDGWTFQARDTSEQVQFADMGQNEIGLILGGQYRDFVFNLSWVEFDHAYFNSDRQWRLSPAGSTYGVIQADLGYTWKLNQQQHVASHFTQTHTYADFDSGLYVGTDISHLARRKA